jgi:hypothetical protein
MEDEIEAVLKRVSEVVADLRDVAGDDFGDVRILVRDRGELLFLRLRLELTCLLLRDCRRILGTVERDGLLPEGEAVDVGVDEEYAWIVISIEKPASRR